MKIILFVFAALILFFAVDYILATTHTFNGVVVSKRFKAGWFYLDVNKVGNTEVPLWREVAPRYILGIICKDTNRQDEVNVSKEKYDSCKDLDEWHVTTIVGRFSGVRYP